MSIPKPFINPRRLKYWASIENGRDYTSVHNPEGKYPVIGSGGAFSKSDAYLYGCTSVLLGRKGTIDRPLFMDEPFWVVDTMYYTVINKDVDPRYFFYCCTQIPYSYFQYGSALPSMTKKDLEDIYLPYQELQIQKKIVCFLDNKCKLIMKCKTQLNKENASLTEFKHSIIMDWFKPINQTIPMKRLLVGIEQGISPSTDENASDSTFKVLTLSSIKDGMFSHEYKYIQYKPDRKSVV